MRHNLLQQQLSVKVVVLGFRIQIDYFGDRLSSLPDHFFNRLVVPYFSPCAFGLENMAAPSNEFQIRPVKKPTGKYKFVHGLTLDCKESGALI